MTAVWDVYVAAGLRQDGCEERNRALLAGLEAAGLSVFLPTLVEGQSPIDILVRNRGAIVGSRMLLGVLDGAGEGVFYELGLAEGQGKPIVLLAGSSPKPGKMLRGKWLELAPDLVANSIQEAVAAVRLVLSHLDAKEVMDA